jgi:type II secretory pathway component HofQ
MRRKALIGLLAALGFLALTVLPVSVWLNVELLKKQASTILAEPVAGDCVPFEPEAAPTRAPHQYQGVHVDLNFKDRDIHDILRLLGDVGAVNIVSAPSVRGLVTIRLRDTPWDQALDLVLRMNRMTFEREGAVLYVRRVCAPGPEMRSPRTTVR